MIGIRWDQTGLAGRTARILPEDPVESSLWPIDLGPNETRLVTILDDTPNPLLGLRVVTQDPDRPQTFTIDFRDIGLLDDIDPLINTTQEHVDVAPLEVVVAGAAPPRPIWRITYATVVVAIWGGAAVCLAVGPTWLVITLAAIAGILTVLFGLNVWAEQHMAGKPEIKAGPDGLWTDLFTVDWADVRSCGFATGEYKYKVSDPSMWVPNDDEATSLVVTRRAADANGRQIQVGYTLYEHHTDNLDELLAAVRHYAPTSDGQFGRSTRDYVPDPSVQSRLLEQWETEGRLTVTNRRGKEKLVFDRMGIQAGRDTAPWESIAALGAVTDSQTTKMNGINTGTTYTHRLVIVTTELDSKGRQRTIRPAYPADYTPPLEQLVPVLQGVVPSLSITDQRRSI